MPAMPTTGPVASEYALLLAALGQDLASLRAIQSVERKIQAKSGMIGRYRAWVAGALASDPPVQDDIVGTMLVWAIDIGDWPLALELGDHVLAANLGLPERYKRSPAVLLAEEIAESAARGHGRAARRARGDAGPHRRPRHARSGARQAAQGFRPRLPGRGRGLRSRGRKPARGRQARAGRCRARPTSRALVLDQHAGVKKVIERLNADLKSCPKPPPRPDTSPFTPDAPPAPGAERSGKHPLPRPRPHPHPFFYLKEPP
jgi:hypothetical protein